MRIVFFGSSHFAVPSLEALIKSRYEVCCVVTQPDKKKGRHLHLGATDVKATAKAAGLTVFQPEKINSPEALDYLKSFGADLFVIAAYGQILSQEVLDIPKIFPINIHASLLPKYRGAAPINWAIIKGEKVTGVTIIKVVRKMDAGPVLLQKEAPININDDAIILEDKLRTLGVELLIEALKEIKDKNFELTEQDEDKVIMAPKLKKADGCIDWRAEAGEIYNLVRGCLPWPGAYTYYKGKLLKIFKAQVAKIVTPQDCFKRGEVVEVTSDKNEIVVVTSSGNLVIEELQLEGARRMSSKDFVHGHKVKAGDRLSDALIKK
jgi:methionyl-tRNA formyltransferase